MIEIQDYPLMSGELPILIKPLSVIRVEDVPFMGVEDNKNVLLLFTGLHQEDGDTGHLQCIVLAFYVIREESYSLIPISTMPEAVPVWLEIGSNPYEQYPYANLLSKGSLN